MIGGPSPPLRSIRWRVAAAYSTVMLVVTALVTTAVIATAENPQVFVPLALAALVPTSLAVGWYVADRAFRRGTIILVGSAAIERGERRRLDVGGPNDEWKRLAGSVDSMLDAIDAETEKRWAHVQDLAHELRNPLAVIATTLDVALGDQDVSIDELRRSAQVARRSVDRVADTVDDLIAFARKETPEAKRTMFELSTVLTEVMADHQSLMDANRVSVERHVDPVVVTGDRDAIKRAIGNIVGNAVRLSRSGSSLRVGTGSFRGFGWVAIDDQGPGLDPFQHQDVFRRFKSYDAASLNGERRSGLGLAITRQIAEQHGGIVTLRSELGAGAELAIWLPLTPEASPGVLSVDGVHPVWSPLQNVAVSPSTEETASFISA
jgi:signal transduction histidine kinase